MTTDRNRTRDQEDLEVIAGRRGPKGRHAVRFSDLDAALKKIINPARKTERAPRAFHLPDMPGANGYEKLRGALEMARRGDAIIGDRSLSINIAESLPPIPSGVHVDLRAMPVTVTASVGVALEGAANGDDIAVRGLRLDCGGLTTTAAIRAAGVDGFTLADFIISKFTARAVAVSSDTDAAVETKIMQGRIHSPVDGATIPVSIGAGPGAIAPRNVLIRDLDGWGSTPINPVHAAYTATNSAPDTFIVAEMVSGLNMRGLRLAYGGAAGVLVGAGCEDVTIADLYAEMMHGVAIRIEGSNGVRLEKLTGRDLGITSAGAAVTLKTSDAVRLGQLVVSAPGGLGAVTGLVASSDSTAEAHGPDFWMGQPATPAQYTATGTGSLSVWAPPVEVEPQLIAMGITAANGTAGAMHNLSVVRAGVGIYDYTLTDAWKDANIIVGVDFGTADRLAGISARTASGFRLTVRDLAGVATDTDHRLTVAATG